MPIPKKWSKFTDENVKKLDKQRGTYELANRSKRTIDVGGSDGNDGVRGRLMSHLRNNKYPTATYFRVQNAGIFDRGIELEASHSHKHQEKHGKKPRYTKRSPRKRGLFDL
jgi:hypothetical protein